VRKQRFPAILLLIALAPSLTGFGCEPTSREQAPAHELTSVDIYASQDIKPFIDSLRDRYLELTGRMIYTTPASRSVLIQHAHESTIADLVVLTSPDEAQIQIVQPWVAERLVIFALGSTEITSLEQIESARGFIASVTELEPLGLYTRLALRAASLWSPLETRVRFHQSPSDVVDAVINKSAAFGITYASHIPPNTPIRVIADLQLPETVQARYDIVPLSDDGEQLARWLLDREVLDRASRAGYAR
jgi:ABC-type molybdate transport system substrate-binding protein